MAETQRERDLRELRDLLEDCESLQRHEDQLGALRRAIDLMVKTERADARAEARRTGPEGNPFNGIACLTGKVPNG